MYKRSVFGTHVPIQSLCLYRVGYGSRCLLLFNSSLDFPVQPFYNQPRYLSMIVCIDVSNCIFVLRAVGTQRCLRVEPHTLHVALC